MRRLHREAKKEKRGTGTNSRGDSTQASVEKSCYAKRLEKTLNGQRRRKIMPKTILEEISSVMAEEKGSLTPKILYEMCDERLHPWGGEKQLRDKLRIVCGVYGLTLRENFLCYDAKNGHSRHRKIDPEAEIADMVMGNPAYGGFLKSLAAHREKYAFDGSAGDRELLLKSVRLVFELNGLLSDAVASYDRLYHQPERDRGNFYALSARLLHLHRPEAVFPYSREIREGMMRFRNVNGCRLGESVLEGAEKSEIKAAFYEAFQALGVLAEGKPALSPEWMYLSATALQYALCRYFTAHCISSEELYPTALAAAVVEKLQKVSTREEIERIAGRLKGYAHRRGAPVLPRRGGV